MGTAGDQELYAKVKEMGWTRPQGGYAIPESDDEFPGQQFTRQNIQTAYGVNHSLAAGDFTLFASDLLTFVPDAAAWIKNPQGKDSFRGFESQLRQMSDINFDIYVHFLMLLYKEEVERRIQKRGLDPPVLLVFAGGQWDHHKLTVSGGGGKGLALKITHPRRMHPSRAVLRVGPGNLETTRKMAPSASKQKCLAEEAAGGTGTTGSDSPSNLTPAGFVNGHVGHEQQGGQHEDLNSMARLMKITDRRLGVASGVLSDPKGCAIKIDQYTLSFHGRLLIEGAEIALNYSQRYGLLGENGSGKSTFLQPIAEHDIKIPEHIDIYLVRGEAEPSEVNAIDFIVTSAKAKVACLEAYIEELSMAYEELEEMDPSTFEAKAGSILHGLRFTQAMKKNPTKDMSSGWRMCVALARALFIKPHLLLDKPTNHSDLDAMVRLEAYLSTYNHTLVITSHSQDFMDTVCTNITDLTHKKKLIYYSGNYSTYIKSKQKIIDIDKMEAAGWHAIKIT
ncbi:hypothetical protein D9613_004310 [Agrocybe pediades]|uniref:ABC transporter domain-containing protein n=1 Tax=Agrocybe pediades TaxID=84607 RepID=A0A8H4QHW0_9AGAR|nr:hypothetical protein D9613_004310 [Agrocybe pediades]